MFAKATLLAAAALSLIPVVRGCVIYSASSSFNGENMDAQLYDNGEVVCAYNGDIGSDGLYRFTCLAANIAAIANTAGVVQYANPGGNYQFQATEFNDGGIIYWSACEYGCSSEIISTYCGCIDISVERGCPSSV